jgi:hypothetical protein
MGLEKRGVNGHRKEESHQCAKWLKSIVEIGNVSNEIGN